jgi:hypothetical protein
MTPTQYLATVFSRHSSMILQKRTADPPTPSITTTALPYPNPSAPTIPSQCLPSHLLFNSGGVRIQHFSTPGRALYSPLPHSTKVLDTGASPTLDFSHSRRKYIQFLIFSPPGSSEPALLSTLVHTCYAHVPAISSTRIVPHGPHHARVAKNTATPTYHSLYKLPTQEARFL